MEQIQKELRSLRDRCMSQDENNAADVLNRVPELAETVSSLAAAVDAIHKFAIENSKRQ